jgi:hypothetical protein
MMFQNGTRVVLNAGESFHKYRFDSYLEMPLPQRLKIAARPLSQELGLHYGVASLASWKLLVAPLILNHDERTWITTRLVAWHVL